MSAAHPPQSNADLHPTVKAVTDRIARRSAASRRAYLELCDRMASGPRGADRLGSAHVPHAVEALPGAA